MKRVVILIIAMLSLAACAPDPRREADAYATRAKADAQSAAMSQALTQDSEAHDLLMAQTREASVWISTMMMTTLIASMFTVFVALASLGIGLSFVFIGAGVATAKRNMTMPNQIKLNPVTRQFPLLPIYIGKGKYSLTNPNDNSVLLMDTRNPADSLKVKGMYATQHDGALAYQARLSHKPGEITQMESLQILDMESMQ